MVNLTGIINNLKKIGGKPLGYATKTLGAAAVVSVLYDSHVNGKEDAFVKEEKNMAKRYDRQYKQYMSMENKSATFAKLKGWWFNSQQNDSLCKITDKVTGYFSGFFSTIASDLPAIVLSVLALRGKTLGKVSGALLGAILGKKVLYDVFGVGNSNKEK